MAKLRISNSTWIFCTIAIIYGLGSYWFYTHYTKTIFTRDMGFTNEARRNPFLAAQNFLNAKKINFEQRDDYRVFDGEIDQFDTVLVNSSRVGMSSESRAMMRDWVASGGHLVLLATETYDYDLESSRDDFLDNLGLRFYEEGSNQSGNKTRKHLTELNFDGYDEATKVELRSTGYLEDTSGNATFIAGTEKADYIIQYELEQGLITVLVDFSIWNNTNISEYDHAMLLTQLIGDSEKTWLIYNHIQPSLLMITWETVPYIVISSAVLLLFLLFGNSWRQGALRRDTKPVQREIMQHLAAAGEFDYHTDNGEAMVARMNDSIVHRLNQLVHGFSRLTLDEQQIKLSHITGIDKKQLALLWQTESDTNDNFVNKARLVQQIRKHL